MVTINKQVKINQLPSGIPKKEDFFIEENPILVPKDGQFLAKSLILSLQDHPFSIFVASSSACFSFAVNGLSIAKAFIKISVSVSVITDQSVVKSFTFK